MGSFTKGKRKGDRLDAHRRVYDRLRKRSYRDIDHYGAWYEFEHYAYVRGVKDALKAIADER